MYVRARKSDLGREYPPVDLFRHRGYALLLRVLPVLWKCGGGALSNGETVSAFGRVFGGLQWLQEVA